MLPRDQSFVVNLAVAKGRAAASARSLTAAVSAAMTRTKKAFENPGRNYRGKYWS
jgi:hypothetical protein